MKNHKFTSVNDVFEHRSVKDIIEEKKVEPTMLQRVFSKKVQTIKKEPLKVKPYRKKL